VKWTLLAAKRDGSEGAATASMKTLPVNQSLGPGAVSIEFLVICISLSVRLRCWRPASPAYCPTRSSSFRR
jgi:hypothetical protein